MTQGNEKGKLLVQWRGYTINKNTQITDSQAIQYIFRNLSNIEVSVNNIILAPKGQIESIFIETLTTDEISFGDYDVKFLSKGADDEILLLNIAIKSYVGTQINKK